MELPMPDVTIGPLKPGVYVLEFPDYLDEATAEAIQDYLSTFSEFRFIVLANGVRIAREPEPVPA